MRNCPAVAKDDVWSLALVGDMATVDSLGCFECLGRCSNRRDGQPLIGRLSLNVVTLMVSDGANTWPTLSGAMPLSLGFVYVGKIFQVMHNRLYPLQAVA